MCDKRGNAAHTESSDLDLTCAGATCGESVSSGNMSAEQITSTVTVIHPQGIHLRVGKDLAYVANSYASTTTTARNMTLATPSVNLKSILQIMQLQARTGHIIQLSADGPDALQAISALRQVLENPDQGVHS